jgi:hypothetical protein
MTQKRWLLIVLSSLALVLLILFFSRKTGVAEFFFNSPEPATTEQIAGEGGEDESPEKKEAEALYQEGLAALAAGWIGDAKSSFETLREKFAELPTVGEFEESITYGLLAQDQLMNVECFLTSESEDQNPARSVDETLQKAVEAINKKDAAALRPLIACNIFEGVPHSEYDPTTPDSAVSRLLGPLFGSKSDIHRF